MREWKAAGALLLAGAIVFMQGIVPASYTDTQIVAKAETLTYTENQSLDIYNGIGRITATYQYTLTENQSWDDTIGAPVYDRYITITDIDLEVYVDLFTSPGYMSYSSYAKMRSIETSDDVVNYTIPAEIDGIPVRILNSSISFSRSGNNPFSTYHTINLTIPESIETISHLAGNTYDNIAAVNLPSTVQKIGTFSIPKSSISFDGTCAELFTVYPYIKQGDGKFTCTDGTLTLNSDTVTLSYDGTRAQWAEICPVNLVSYTASCSDGDITVDPPIPENPHYSFNKSTKTAVYIGNEDTSITSLSIPAVVEGYTVTGIAEYALLGCPNLTAVEIPSTVNHIGSHAVGYWENSDGSYSKMSKVVIYCEEGSTAHAYAVENGLSYQIGAAPVQTTPPETTTTIVTTTDIWTEPWSEPPATVVTEPPSEPPMTTTSRSTTTTTTAPPTITIHVTYGDVDCDGEVNIMDVILLNRNLMIGAPISVQGMINADVDRSDPNTPDAVDALNILKAVVKLITLPV